MGTIQLNLTTSKFSYVKNKYVLHLLYTFRVKKTKVLSATDVFREQTVKTDTSLG